MAEFENMVMSHTLHPACKIRCFRCLCKSEDLDDYFKFKQVTNAMTTERRNYILAVVAQKKYKKEVKAELSVVAISSKVNEMSALIFCFY